MFSHNWLRAETSDVPQVTGAPDSQQRQLASAQVTVTPALLAVLECSQLYILSLICSVRFGLLNLILPGKESVFVVHNLYAYQRSYTELQPDLTPVLVVILWYSLTLSLFCQFTRSLLSLRKI